MSEPDRPVESAAYSLETFRSLEGKRSEEEYQGADIATCRINQGMYEKYIPIMMFVCVFMKIFSKAITQLYEEWANPENLKFRILTPFPDSKETTDTKTEHEIRKRPTRVLLPVFKEELRRLQGNLNPSDHTIRSAWWHEKSLWSLARIDDVIREIDRSIDTQDQIRLHFMDSCKIIFFRSYPTIGCFNSISSREFVGLVKYECQQMVYEIEDNLNSLLENSNSLYHNHQIIFKEPMIMRIGDENLNGFSVRTDYAKKPIEDGPRERRKVGNMTSNVQEAWVDCWTVIVEKYVDCLLANNHLQVNQRIAKDARKWLQSWVVIFHNATCVLMHAADKAESKKEKQLDYAEDFFESSDEEDEAEDNDDEDDEDEEHNDEDEDDEDEDDEEEEGDDNDDE
ncbi:hypothetical protein PSHT_13384 [Puccinia striiformis]|uniref:Uncharacterized protein n=1 Tax=Puccinia striiformis TaxID=27350 RepID=A0A2S4URD7_9BASI|nr:hypothetical protein PSHT_13384 [Puccinia striiformis]